MDSLRAGLGIGIRQAHVPVRTVLRAGDRHPVGRSPSSSLVGESRRIQLPPANGAERSRSYGNTRRDSVTLTVLTLVDRCLDRRTPLGTKGHDKAVAVTKYRSPGIRARFARLMQPSGARLLGRPKRGEVNYRKFNANS